jgi:DNA-directed RNA polymerase specialized sigma24 family protein
VAVQQTSFETVWPALSGRLKRVLQSRRVPDECVDDVIQETGLRLLRNWSSIDHSTIWSFTLTIAGNIIKDDMRRRVRDERFAESLPPNSYVDIEERALARVELWKAHRAIDGLSTVQRAALLTDVYGIDSAAPVNAGAAKMSRLRARRRLRQALGRASGLIALGGHRFRRLMLGDPNGGLTESASHTVAAALLIAAGVDLVMLGGGLFQTRVPHEVGRVAMNATFGTNSTSSNDAVFGSTPASIESALGPRWLGATGGHAAGSPGEVLQHEEEVGPGGARGSLRSSLAGQRASIDLTAQREMKSCQGRTATATPCLGGMSVEAAAHYNGKTYGARANSDGTVAVESPYNVDGS